jgi:membrane fusion protein, heavy metal efflux system
LTRSREDAQLSPSVSAHQRKIPLVVGLVATVFLAILAYVGFQGRSQEAEPPAPTPVAATQRVVLSETAQRDAGVTVEIVQMVPRRVRLEAPGVLSLDEGRTARIGSMVEGTIVSVSVQVGERVTSGTALAEIHSHIIHDVWAEYRKAIADHKRRLTELDYAVQADQRAQRLYTDKAISLQELQRARVDRVTAEQSLDMTKTEVRRTEEALEHLGITSGEDPRGESGEQIPVKSPLAGAVLEKNVTAGTAVTPGMQLFVVSDLSTLWALVEVDETKIPSVTVGLPVEVRVAAYPGESFPGTVVFIGDTLDPKTRRVTVRCRVPNPQGKLKPQMYTTLSFAEGESHAVLAVPSQAIQELEGKTVVFVAEDAGKFLAREVTLGSEIEGRVEILTGVTSGEKVATLGSFLLKSELTKSAIDAEE